MRIGLKLFGQGWPIETHKSVWQLADQAGFDHCWTSDHLVGIDAAPSAGVFDGWSLLSAMASQTTHVRLGCLVSANTFRHPGLLAKMAVTVDHLSGGRLEFGIGAAWSHEDHSMLGLEFGSAGSRVDRLEESCRLIKCLWTEDHSSLSGHYYTLDNATQNPKPVQQPHPPIWIGGTGERKTLRVVAMHADVWNAPGCDPSEFRRLAAILDDHCNRVGRNPSEVRRSVQVRYAQDPDEMLRLADAYSSAGVQDLVMVFVSDNPMRDAHHATALLPRLQEL